MRDQPLKPIDMGVFWVEHVLKHKGAEHFKTGALNLKWYELYQIDVVLFVVLIIISVIYVPYKILKYFLCKKKCNTYKGEKQKTN